MGSATAVQRYFSCSREACGFHTSNPRQSAAHFQLTGHPMLPLKAPEPPAVARQVVGEEAGWRVDLAIESLEYVRELLLTVRDCLRGLEGRDAVQLRFEVNGFLARQAPEALALQNLRRLVVAVRSGGRAPVSALLEAEDGSEDTTTRLRDELHAVGWRLDGYEVQLGFVATQLGTNSVRHATSSEALLSQVLTGQGVAHG